MTLTPKTAANALSALGHEVRLHIFRLLVQAGHEGLNVGDIGAHLGMPPSTLSHHLTSLVQAGLVHQERQGRIIINRVEYEQMQGLINYLSEQCCEGVTHIANDDVA